MLLVRSLIPAIIAAQFCFAATQAHAATPARFSADEASLENLLLFPDVSADVTAEVYCRAVISVDGEMRQNFCFRSESVDQEFRDAIDTAAESARLSPAVVSDEPRRVIYWYRVVFVRAGERSLIRVFPNWGRDTEKYGNEYIGPQRVSRLMLPRSCSTRGAVTINPADSVRSNFDDFSISLVATLTIDASGAPVDDIAFESASSVDDARCRTSIRDLLKRSEYIPGYHNGEPVDATYVQPVGVFEDMEFR